MQDPVQPGLLASGQTELADGGTSVHRYFFHRCLT